MLGIMAKAKIALKTSMSSNTKVNKHVKVVSPEEAMKKVSTEVRKIFHSCADINFSIPISKNPTGACRTALQKIIAKIIAIDLQSRIFPMRRNLRRSASNALSKKHRRYSMVTGFQNVSPKLRNFPHKTDLRLMYK